MEPKWLTWAKELQAIAQAGLAYSKDKYDIERFQRIRDLSVDILSEYTDMGHEKIKDLFCNEVGYQTPKVDVRGAVFQDDKILLVKESIDGCWSMPGGWADNNLSIKENVIKEVKEEAGLNVIPIRLLAVLDRKKHNEPATAYGIYKVFVLCEIIDGAFEKNIETEESGFFNLDSLPTLSVSRITRKQIEMCYDTRLNKGLPTLFD